MSQPESTAETPKAERERKPRNEAIIVAPEPDVLLGSLAASAGLNPDAFLAEVTRIVVETAKDLWRKKPLTREELDRITDRILLLAERKEQSDGNTSS